MVSRSRPSHEPRKSRTSLSLASLVSVMGLPPQVSLREAATAPTNSSVTYTTVLSNYITEYKSQFSSTFVRESSSAKRIDYGHKQPRPRTLSDVTAPLRPVGRANMSSSTRRRGVEPVRPARVLPVAAAVASRAPQQTAERLVGSGLCLIGAT